MATPNFSASDFTARARDWNSQRAFGFQPLANAVYTSVAADNSTGFSRSVNASVAGLYTVTLLGGSAPIQIYLSAGDNPYMLQSWQSGPGVLTFLW